jgi:hypothetical protein
MGTPIQRIGAPEEIAAFASYIASESSGFVTGTLSLVLPVTLIHTALLLSPRRPMCTSIFLSFVSMSIMI